MSNVFVVQHTNPQNQDVKFIGIYSSYENAEAAVTRMSNVRGFSDGPLAAFSIDQIIMDQDYWTEGF